MTDKQKVTAICQECGKQFDYDLTPGFPRKYCIECGEIKKASYDARIPKSDDEKAFDADMEGRTTAPIPTVRPGEAAKTAERAPMNEIQVGVYTSYAKDIFCALITGSEVIGRTPEQVMEDAILLVKQAREAFE